LFIIMVDKKGKNVFFLFIVGGPLFGAFRRGGGGYCPLQFLLVRCCIVCVLAFLVNIPGTLLRKSKTTQLFSQIFVAAPALV